MYIMNELLKWIRSAKQMFLIFILHAVYNSESTNLGGDIVI